MSKEQPLVVTGKVQLRQFDPRFWSGPDKDQTKQATAVLHERIGELQQLLYANGTHSILLLFQGMDASGKDGAVRHVLKEVNPAGVETANFKVPSDEERAHDFLWRIHRAVPRYGNIGVFNRSHYEAVLVERVLKIVPVSVWSRRFEQIVNFERMLVENNVIVLKFFLHISKEEQAERLAERLREPHKRWKFNLSDLKSREAWKEYQTAYEDVLNKTSHPAAPWHVIPAERNWSRDYFIADTVVKALAGLKLKWPKPAQDLGDIQII